MFTAKQETGIVGDETVRILAQKKQIEAKQQLLNFITAKFSLNPDDLECLTSPAAPVDERFFAALAKVKRVHQDCQVLLGSENQTLGLSIMDKSSKTLDEAFEKLYRWLRQQIKTLDLENPQLSISIRKGLRVLAERPALFKDCVDYFAQSREHVLSEMFVAALTGSSMESKTTTKPIELLAHDSMRYVGDMLAWLHATAVSESEALEALFIVNGDELAEGIQVGLENDPWERSKAEGNESFDGVKALKDLVNQSLVGAVKLLRQRVEQVISAVEDPTSIFQLGNLIQFYESTFERLLGNKAATLDTLGGLRESAFKQFQALMKERAAAVEAEPPHTSLDLKAAEFLEEALEELKEIMTSYNTSLSPAEDQETEFDLILREALDPFVKICEDFASALDEPARDIFTLNCLCAVKNTLVNFSFTNVRVRRIDEMINRHAQKLIDQQHAFFLHTSGLHPLVASLAPPPQTPVQTSRRRQESCSPQT